jgi:hypothetical protein
MGRICETVRVNDGLLEVSDFDIDLYALIALYHQLSEPSDSLQLQVNV